MRLLTLLLPLTAFVSYSAAWTKEDHEIFRLQDEVTSAYGSNTTFYSLIGVAPSATHEEITKAYRRKSKQMHPDKVVHSIIAERQNAAASAKRDADRKSGKAPGAHVSKGPTSKEREKMHNEANRAYQRLSVVGGVLRGPERQRYDHFMRNGFPRWKGTGYYYERFRPGLGSVVLGLLVVFGGGVHYGALYMGWKRHRDFVERYIRHARKEAWGNEEGIPGLNGTASPAEIAAQQSINQPFGGDLNGAAAADQAEQDMPQPRNRKEKRAMEKDAKKKEKSSGTIKGRASRGTPSREAADTGISRPFDAEAMGGPQGNKKRVVAKNGKVLIVDSIGNVFLEEETVEGEKHEFLLDPDEIPAPTIYQTALFRLPIWMYAQTIGRAFNKPSKLEEPLFEGDEVLQSPESQEDEVMSSATSQNVKAETRKRKAKTKDRVERTLAARNEL